MKRNFLVLMVLVILFSVVDCKNDGRVGRRGSRKTGQESTAPESGRQEAENLNWHELAWVKFAKEKTREGKFLQKAFIALREAEIFEKVSNQKYQTIGKVGAFQIISCGVSSGQDIQLDAKCLPVQGDKVCWQDLNEYILGPRETFWVIGKSILPKHSSTYCKVGKWTKEEFLEGRGYAFRRLVKNPPNVFPAYDTKEEIKSIRQEYEVSTIVYTGKQAGPAGFCGNYYEISAQPKIPKIKCVEEKDVAEGFLEKKRNEKRVAILRQHTEWPKDTKINLAKGLVAFGLTPEMVRAALGEPADKRTSMQPGREEIIFKYSLMNLLMQGRGAELTFANNKLEKWRESDL